MTTEDIRSEQIRAGRSMAADEREAYVPLGKRRITVTKGGGHGAPKKPEGHDAHLKMLIQSDAEIEIEFLDGTMQTGIVKHADKFTISIKIEGEGTTCFFKHGIRGFTPTDKDRVKE